jgi:hypothetical protein
VDTEEICPVCRGQGTEYDPAHDWYGPCPECVGYFGERLNKTREDPNHPATEQP